jgi:hypothetical protein
MKCAASREVKKEIASWYFLLKEKLVDQHDSKLRL